MQSNTSHSVANLGILLSRWSAKHRRWRRRSCHMVTSMSTSTAIAEDCRYFSAPQESRSLHQNLGFTAIPSLQRKSEVIQAQNRYILRRLYTNGPTPGTDGSSAELRIRPMSGVNKFSTRRDLKFEIGRLDERWLGGSGSSSSLHGNHYGIHPSALLGRESMARHSYSSSVLSAVGATVFWVLQGHTCVREALHGNHEQCAHHAINCRKCIM